LIASGGKYLGNRVENGRLCHAFFVHRYWDVFADSL